MERLTVSRSLPVEAERVRDAITEVGPFMRAGGFDEVAVDGDTFTIRNHVGLLTVELDLELVSEPSATLAYEQREGIFAEMTTEYLVEDRDADTLVRARTDFELDTSLVGPLLDATVVKRQRRRELDAQFDYLASI